MARRKVIKKKEPEKKGAVAIGLATGLVAGPIAGLGAGIGAALFNRKKKKKIKTSKRILK